MDRLDDLEPEVESMEVEESQGLDILKAERLAQAKEKKERLETKFRNFYKSWWYRALSSPSWRSV